MARDLEVHLIPKDLYYHEVGYVRGLEASVKELTVQRDALAEALGSVRQELWVDYCLHVNTSRPDKAATERFESRPHIRIIDSALAGTLADKGGTK